MTENTVNEMPLNFSEDQVRLIKSQIAPKATDNELKLFLYQAKRTGLDPLTRQIYAIHRKTKEWEYGKEVWKEKMSIQTSIDGFRVIAERSGNYGGQDEPIFTEEDGVIISCKVTVYRFRGDVRYPASVGVAYWSEYVQTDKENKPSGLWKKMPHTMIAKVAEALALRKAYPQDLSGLYTSDEMEQANIADVTPKEDSEKPKNAAGLNPNGELANGDDMKQTFEAQAIKDFSAIKKELEACEDLDSLGKCWKKWAKELNSFKNRDKTRYDLLEECKDIMKNELDTDLEDVAKLDNIK